MALTYKLILYAHILLGFSSLVFFWLPVAAKKGSAFHARSGHWYANAMYAVGASAMVLSLMLMIDPVGFKFANQTLTSEQTARVVSQNYAIGVFLFAISMLVMVGVRQGLQAVRAKGNQALMRRADNLIVNVILLGVGLWLGYNATGNSPMNVLFYIFAGLCSVTAITNLRFNLKRNVTRADQIVAHISAIIGAGIGSHTAFFVFGSSRLFAELLTGYAALVPWVLPSVVGFWLIARQTRRFRPAKKRKSQPAQAIV